MSDDKLKFQYNALKWVFEHQLLDDPQVMNHLAMNVFDVSKSIKDVEFLLARDQRQLLIYVELSWFGRTFKRKSLFEETENALAQMLPTFKFRVTDDPKIFKMSLDNVKKALTGGSREVSTQSIAGANTNGVSSGSVAAPVTDSAPSQPTAPQTDPQKQPEDQPGIRSEAVPSDSDKERKV